MSQASEREKLVLVLEQHISTAETAILVLANSIKHQRDLLNELKALDGWTWSAPAPAHVFGDTVPTKQCELQIVERAELQN